MKNAFEQFIFCILMLLVIFLMINVFVMNKELDSIDSKIQETTELLNKLK
jgi:Tfp pilus assembly protein PilO